MSNAVVTKQGKLSAPGTVVDTSTAEVVPASSEVKTEAAAREVAAQGKASREKIGELAKGMTHPVRQKDAAVKAAAGKGSTKAKPAAKKVPAKPRSAGNASGPVARLTDKWPSKKGRDVQIKDVVKTRDNITIEVIGRWTRRKGDQLIPCVTGHIVSFGAAKTDPTEGGKGRTIGDRMNAVAAEVTHTSEK